MTGTVKFINLAALLKRIAAPTRMNLCRRKLVKYLMLPAGTVMVYLCINYIVKSAYTFVSSGLEVSNKIETPPGNFLCYTCYGRLGNHMFQYASLMGIAALNNLTLLVGKEERLYKVFALKNVTILDNRDVCNKFEFIEERMGCCRFDKDLMTLPKGKSFKVGHYLQSWKYFYHIEDVIRRQFQFRENIDEKANHVLKRIMVRFRKNSSTLIGIHIRIGDILDEANNRYGLVIAPEGYIYKAMDYMKARFLNIIFVVASDDLKWSKTVLSVRANDSIYFLEEGNIPEVDLAVLAYCDHVIQTVGTFGWWAGFLAGGISIYYPHPGRIGSKGEARYNYTDFFLPNWIPIDL